jgi:putative ABC transport system substrate-binding protein
MSKRRELVIALGASALVAPLGSFAQQQGKVWRIGFLSLMTRPESLSSHTYGAFPKGMRALGYVEGKNLTIEWRFADGNVERLPDMAAELVQLNVDVIVAAGAAAINAARRATTTIPIVMGTTGDPLASGFVKSLARPEGNITGLSNLGGDVSAKLFELLLSVVPTLSRVGVLLTPTSSTYRTISENIQAAAQKAGVKTVLVEASNSREIENAFSILARENVGAVIVGASSFLTEQRHQIAALANKYRLPSVFGNRASVQEGGLMSYGGNQADNFLQAASYVDKILKGAKPGDLPVEQVMTFELTVNLTTAKALGLTIPQSLLLRADEVIQ